MSNKIVEGLLSGRLAMKANIAFDRNTPCYFILFASGSVGVFAQTPGTSLYGYAEFAVVNGTVKQSSNPVRTLKLSTSINSLFSGVINHNAALVDDSKDPAVLDPYFVTGLKWFNPKGKSILEDVAIGKFAFLPEVTAKLNKADRYQKEADLAQQLKTFILDTITENQKNNQNNWTVDGALALAVEEPLSANAKILSDFAALNEFATTTNQQAASLNDLVTRALKGTDWSVSRPVDLSQAPFFYLLPKNPVVPENPTA